MVQNMVLLVGEQPAPNVIPALHVKPSTLVLVHTSRTTYLAGRLQQFLKGTGECEFCQVDPYELTGIQDTLAKSLGHRLSSEWMFNVTGGTKQMAIAASLIAQRHGCQLAYLQTEGNRSRLLVYSTEAGRLKLLRDEELPPTLKLDEYLRLYLGEYEERPPPAPDAFEKAVLDVIRSEGTFDEVFCNVVPRAFGNIEIDFVIRVGAQVGVGEVKRKANKSRGIDQLESVASQQGLGTYVHKFLVSANSLHPNDKQLAENRRITVVELGDLTGDALTPGQREKVVGEIGKRMSSRP